MFRHINKIGGGDILMARGKMYLVRDVLYGADGKADSFSVLPVHSREKPFALPPESDDKVIPLPVLKGCTELSTKRVYVVGISEAGEALNINDLRKNDSFDGSVYCYGDLRRTPFLRDVIEQTSFVHRAHQIAEGYESPQGPSYKRKPPGWLRNEQKSSSATTMKPIPRDLESAKRHGVISSEIYDLFRSVGLQEITSEEKARFFGTSTVHDALQSSTLNLQVATRLGLFKGIPVIGVLKKQNLETLGSAFRSASMGGLARQVGTDHANRVISEVPTRLEAMYQEALDKIVQTLGVVEATKAPRRIKAGSRGSSGPTSL